MKRYLPKLFFCSLFVLLFVSLVVRMYVFSKLATKGDELKSYELQIAAFSKENQSLRQKIADISSLSRIKVEAVSLGMVTPTTSDFLTQPPAASVNTSLTDKL